MISDPQRPRPADDPAIPLEFWFFAVTLVVICLGFASSFPLVRLYRFPLLDFGKLTGLNYPALATYLASLGAMWLLYLGAFALARGRRMRGGLPWLMATGGVMALSLLFMYPITANDLFDTFFNARILTYYHTNPLVVPAAAFPHDPFIPFKAWYFEHAGDGPLWWELSMLVSIPAGTHLLAGVLGLKFLVVLFYVASIPLVWMVLERVRPDDAFAGTLLYAWNPVLLYEGAGNGHMDLVMMFYVLAAWCALTLQRDWLVLPLLVLSVLAKFVTLLLVPPVLWYFIWRTSGRKRIALLVGSGAFAFLLALAVYAPLWTGSGSTVVAGRQKFITTSPAIVLQYFYGTHQPFEALANRVGARGGTDAPGTLARYSVYGLFGACYAWFGWRAKNGTRELLRSWCMIMFSYLAIATLWFQPWYLAWFVAPATLLVDDFPMLRRMVMFSISSLAPYYVFFVWVAKRGPVPFEQVQTIATAIMFAPVLALAVYDVTRWLAGRREHGGDQTRGVILQIQT